jgi:hypothetical protein
MADLMIEAENLRRVTAIDISEVFVRHAKRLEDQTAETSAMRQV